MEIREPKKNEISAENKVIRLIVIDMYIYIYISVNEFKRLLHCHSPLIFSFLYSIELSVDVEVKQFGALAMLCTVSHVIVNLYIWVSHT